MSARTASRPQLRARAPRQLLARLGRAALWVAVSVVLLRGVSATLATRPAPPLSRAASAVAVWPDDAVRAFAAEFAIAYLDQSPADAAGPVGSGLAVFAAPEL